MNFTGAHRSRIARVQPRGLAPWARWQDEPASAARRIEPFLPAFGFRLEGCMPLLADLPPRTRQCLTAAAEPARARLNLGTDGFHRIVSGPTYRAGDKARPSFRLKTEQPFHEITSGAPCELVFDERLAFSWQRGGHEIRYTWLWGEAAPSLLRYYVLHRLMPVFLELDRGIRVLHAGGVRGRHGAAVFLAPSGGGKSTLAHACVRAGGLLMADDLLAVVEDASDDTFAARPAYPWCRPYRAAQSLGDFVDQAEFADTPIRTIYVLERAEANARIEHVALSQRDAFMAIKSGYWLHSRFVEQDQFRQAIALGQAAEVVSLRVPDAMERVGEVAAYVLDRLGGAVAAATHAPKHSVSS